MVFKETEMVLFDLDGTLVDSAPDLAYSVDATLHEIGLPARGEAKIRHWIGNGIERTLKRAMLDNMAGEPDADLFNKALSIFMEIYSNNATRQSRFYDGARESMDYLKNNDYMIGCVTNKREKFTHILLKELGVFDYFGVVISGDTLPKKKPDPLPLLHAAEYFNVRPEHALMVGDSTNDVYAARAAGFKILCVSYGYNHGRDIREARPDAVVDSLAELPVLMSA
jgi:phosphoglycolate phosphatase